MSKVGKAVTYILVVLLVLGLAGGIAYFALKEEGVTYYAEYGGERYFANGEAGKVYLTGDKTHDFAVKTLTGNEVNFDVKVTANAANNFAFTCGGKLYQFASTDDDGNDYSKVFGLQKKADGFSLVLPAGFTVKQAVETKYGGAIELQNKLQGDLCYFGIHIVSGESEVTLWLQIPEITITLDPSEIVF